MMDAKEFLAVIFEEMPEDESICISRAIPKKDGSGAWFQNYKATDRQWRKANMAADVAWYFCVSSITGELNEKGSMVGRGRSQIVATYCIVLDDIGTKAKEPPVQPSWKLETSKGNFQWGYIIDRTIEEGRVEALMEYCHKQGWGDEGAGGSYRLMRVPGSTNTKPGRQNFKARITHWEPIVWTLDELADDLNYDLSEAPLHAGEFNHGVKQHDGGALAAMDGVDPLLDWIVDAGMVISDTGSEWVDITCPWADQHTSGENKAGYSPLGRGSGDWVQTRAFKCLHEHCVGQNFGSFVDWCGKKGAPKVSGHDPLPWLQKRYVYVTLGQWVADLQQRARGGSADWLIPFADWSNLYRGRVRLPGRDSPIEMKSAFLESSDTVKAMNTKYDPGAGLEELIVRDDQLNVNLYVPPVWPQTDDEPKVFLEHIDYLFGEYAPLVLDWFAWKIQNPGLRSWCIVCVANEAFGIGRSWIGRILQEMLKGDVKYVSLGQICGRGTSAEQNYNDWGVGCQYVVVAEARDTLSKDDFYNGYEAFKQNVDNEVVKMRVNQKYGKTRDDYLWFNCLIFSNHSDAMILPDDDRRCCVLENPTERRSEEYYDQLHKSLKQGEPMKLYNYLKRRDVSSFGHVYPPMTEVKRRMLEESKSPAEEIQEAVLESFEEDIVTRDLVIRKTRQIAFQLSHASVAEKPGGVGRHIWLSLGNLRGVKNGARYLIEGVQTEVRTVREKKGWKEIDANRNAEKILKSLEKNMETKIILLKSMK